MKTRRLVTVLLLVASPACKAPAPEASADPVVAAALPPDAAPPPPPTASASLADPEAWAPADLEKAFALVRALPEVAALGASKSKLVLRMYPRTTKPCWPGDDGICPMAGEVDVLAGIEVDGYPNDELRFLVALPGGAISVDAGFQLHASPDPQRMPHATWAVLHARHQAALGIVRGLPEVGQMERDVESTRAPDGPLHLALWTEGFPNPGCDVSQRDCWFRFYVGEWHNSHTVRWESFLVGTEARTIRVGAYDEGAPYDRWRAGRKAAGLLVEPFPDLVAGRGDLGYGAPDKVVASAAAWGHPVKDALAQQGFSVERVELYRNGKYPVLFVRPTAARGTLLDRAGKNPWEIRLAAHAILEANGGFPFELCEVGGGERERYRYRGASATFERRVGEAWKGL